MAEKRSGCDELCDELDFSERTRFLDILALEYDEIDERRRNASADGTAPDRVNGRPPRLTGIALSGGGIRSATFNLGMLQALNEAGKLDRFDYLSTISGGGYCGGWWSAWLSRDRAKREIFPPPERVETQRDARRAAMEEAHSRADYDRAQIKDSAITAAVDPIHHLRLFSNFLTPTKGLLSGDTWQAIAVIGRNLSLTWMILLPILLAAIMAGQAVFAIPAWTGKGLLWRSDVERPGAKEVTGSYITSERTSGDDDRAEEVDPRTTRNPDDFRNRLLVALGLPAALLIGSFVCVTFWMLMNRRCWALRDILVVGLSGTAFMLLTWFLLEAANLEAVLQPALGWLILAWFAFLILVLLRWRQRNAATASDLDFWRNRIVLAQTRTLKYSAFLAVVLLFAAFGHEIIDFLLAHRTLQNSAADAAARAGGWGALILGALSSVYTALKASPTGGEDKSAAATAKPSLVDRIAFAIAPPLLLLILGVVLAWVGHRLYTTVYRDDDFQIWFVVRGALVSGLLFLVFALYEFRPRQQWKSGVVIAMWLVIAVGQYYVPIEWAQSHLVTIGGIAAIAVAAGLLVRAFLSRHVGIVFAAAAVAAAGMWLLEMLRPVQFMLDENSHVPQLIVGGILATLTLLIFELTVGKGGNTRSIGLIIFGFVMFAAIGMAACAGPAAWRALAMTGLISSILGWVLALGWLADPNALTIHGFYKSRLVRAYMGASNVRRAAAKDSDISDAVPGDDVLLVDLQNARQGAPYHLIGTTLNLVGGRDLATQQRFSEFFIMSKLWCGSTRTGFRRTDEYACGTISLGTAVSVSGAAASPNMGAQTPSAALAALLTLFNVRLGYWAPTPNQSYWRSGSARLWPVYTLQELLSQTTDLLPFCNLSDGGHYENTGIYPLVQRGCKFIVCGDVGADRYITLDDLGNAIRKVRIDFGAEIHFDDAEVKKLREQTEHFVTGTVRYHPAHAAAIGLGEDEESRTGTIVIVKPNRAGQEPVDVLQYGYRFDDFPQQSTADQWYDEAQFESYRQLGYTSGRLLVQSAALAGL